MVLKKQELLDLIHQLPDDVDVELLMQQLYLKAKLDRSEEAAKNGLVCAHEQLQEEVQQWGK